MGPPPPGGCRGLRGTHAAGGRVPREPARWRQAPAAYAFAGSLPLTASLGGCAGWVPTLALRARGRGNGTSRARAWACECVGAPFGRHSSPLGVHGTSTRSPRPTSAPSRSMAANADILEHLLIRGCQDAPALPSRGRSAPCAAVPSPSTLAWPHRGRTPPFLPSPSPIEEAAQHGRPYLYGPGSSHAHPRRRSYRFRATSTLPYDGIIAIFSLGLWTAWDSPDWFTGRWIGPDACEAADYGGRTAETQTNGKSPPDSPQKCVSACAAEIGQT